MKQMNACQILLAASALMAFASSGASAQERYENWPLLRSTFESTGGGGIIIKGYDPVIVGDTCVTTFMAVTPGPDVKAYYNVVEFEAVAGQGGILCRNGKWRSMDGNASGTTPFQIFFKDGVARRSP